MTPVVTAALWMSGAIVSFTLMAIAGRAVQLELDTFEVMFYRSLIGMALVFSVAYASGSWRQITTRHMGQQLIRNLSHFAGQNLWFYALTAIPLAQVFALEFTSPVWVTLLAPLLLGEHLTRVRAFCALLGFVGILIVSRPDPANINPGTLSAALAAIGFAGSALFTKRLARTETLTCILAWLTVMQAVFGLICAGYDGDIALPSARMLPGLGVIGLAGIVAHSCLTRALMAAPAGIVMPIDFLRLPVIAIIGMLLYGEPLETWVFVGGAVILAANLLNLRSEARLR